MNENTQLIVNALGGAYGKASLVHVMGGGHQIWFNGEQGRAAVDHLRSLIGNCFQVTYDLNGIIVTSRSFHKVPADKVPTTIRISEIELDDKSIEILTREAASHGIKTTVNPLSIERADGNKWSDSLGDRTGRKLGE